MRTLPAMLGLAIGLAFTSPGYSHSDHEWIKGPQGGHIVDAGDGKQHWELVAAGNELTLYVLDADEKPVKVQGSNATGQVLVGDKTYNVKFTPAGDNVMKATGEFTAVKGMKVIVKTDNVGGESFQARLAPLH